MHKAGGNMGSVDFFGATPLHLAAVFGNTTTAELLLELGAPANIADRCAATHAFALML